MVVQEVDVDRRQSLGLADPGVADLAGAGAHERCVSMAPARGGEQLPDQRRCIRLVAAPHQ